VAQVHGKGDTDEMRATFTHATVIALIIALVILVLQKYIIDAGLQLVGGSEDVKYYARVYISWAIWAAPAVLITMSLFGWLLGMQNAVATLYITITINIINIVLDFLFGNGILSDGAVLMFDDWNCNRASPNHGQRRAWRECVGKHGISYSDCGDYGSMCHKFIVHR